MLHGHNWAFRVTFAAKKPDECGFVIDFGKLGFLKDYISAYLDHACVVSKSDPELHTTFRRLANEGLLSLYVVDDASAEGLAEHIGERFNSMVLKETEGRVGVVSVEVFEDAKNSVLYTLRMPSCV